jgi:hypothetical protein
MPLTEEQIAGLEAEHHACECVGVTMPHCRCIVRAGNAPCDVPALIAALRASQAEARQLRERLASLGVAWHDTVHMTEINPDIDFARCPKWSCREARAAIVASDAAEGT